MLVVPDPGTDVRAVWSAIRANPPPGTEEVVAGAETVLVVTSDPGARERLSALASRPVPSATGREHVIPVEYRGADMQEVAAEAGLSVAEVAARHAQGRYVVDFMGFSPGFPYLSGGDPALQVARRSSPRRSVPAGSVALAARWTGIYPQATPGGWRIVGRTDAVLFDPGAAVPALLQPGDRVRFRPVARVAAAPPVRADPATSEPPATTGVAYVRVLEPGPLTTVQDRGRVGWAHAGVPRAGALDQASAAAANRLVGNTPHAAVLESTLSGPRLVLGTDRVVAVTGARADITVDGMPARQDTPLYLRAGSELAVGRFRAGVRAYIAFAGGVAVAPVMGSRSTDTLAGLGPPAVAAGVALPLGRPSDTAPAPGSRATPARARTGVIPPTDGVVSVRFQAGPGYGFEAELGAALIEREFVVAPSSDRTGVRLEGRPLPAATDAELPSHGMIAGAIQLPSGGQPIVLMRNHPTTGGYPVIGVVDPDGVDALAQAPAGTRVHLQMAEPGKSVSAEPAPRGPAPRPAGASP